MGPYLADSAGPAATGTEQVAGGGAREQAPAAGAGGAAVCPAMEGDGQKDSLSPSASPKPQGVLHRAAWQCGMEHWSLNGVPELRAPGSFSQPQASGASYLDHPGGLILYLFLLDEIFALSYIPMEQIELFKNVNQTKSSLLLKHSQGKWHYVWNELSSTPAHNG